MTLLASLITLALNAPHRPLLEVITTIRIFSGGEIRPYTFSTSESERLCERSTSNSCNLFAYGLSLTILSCAFRNLAAETIFMADVICLVDLKEVNRIFIAFKFAIWNSFIQLNPFFTVDI